MRPLFAAAILTTTLILIDASALEKGARPSSSESIRLEGDSYMGGACGLNLQSHLKRAIGRDIIVTAEGGSTVEGIRDRILDPRNSRLLINTTVFWDGSQNGFTSAREYSDVLAEAIHGLGHERFIVIPAAVPAGLIPKQTLDIQREFKSRWPANFLDWRTVLTTDPNGALTSEEMCDSTHLNDEALSDMAAAIAKFVRAKQW